MKSSISTNSKIIKFINLHSSFKKKILTNNFLVIFMPIFMFWMLKFINFYVIRYLKILFILWINFFNVINNKVNFFGIRNKFIFFGKYFYTYYNLSIISFSSDKFKFLSFRWNLQLFYYTKIQPLLWKKKRKNKFRRFKRYRFFKKFKRRTSLIKSLWRHRFMKRIKLVSLLAPINLFTFSGQYFIKSLTSKWPPKIGFYKYLRERRKNRKKIIKRQFKIFLWARFKYLKNLNFFRSNNINKLIKKDLNFLNINFPVSLNYLNFLKKKNDFFFIPHFIKKEFLVWWNFLNLNTNLLWDLKKYSYKFKKFKEYSECDQNNFLRYSRTKFRLRINVSFFEWYIYYKDTWIDREYVKSKDFVDVSPVIDLGHIQRFHRNLYQRLLKVYNDLKNEGKSFFIGTTILVSDKKIEALRLKGEEIKVYHLHTYDICKFLNHLKLKFGTALLQNKN